MVRLLVSDSVDNAPAKALRHSYGRLLSSGVEIWEYPAVMHAKVIIADDVTIVGSVNLDSWALNRNLEIALRFGSTDVADRAQAQFADVAIAQSVPGRKPTSVWPRARNWMMSRVAYFL